jgi:hypothetical protein
MVPSHTIRTTLGLTLNSIALNDAQRLVCFNPDPEVNSLGERIASLRTYGVPEPVIKALFGDVKAVLELNAIEGANERQTAGELDQLATVINDAERNGTSRAAHAVVAAESIKQIACQLRPHLAVLRGDGEHDGTAWSVADATVRDVIRRTPRSRLLSPTMHHQLRDGPFDQLRKLIGVHA